MQNVQAQTSMKEQTQAPRLERRWPLILAILAVIVLLGLLPDRLRLFPGGLLYVIGIAALVPIVVVAARAINILGS